MPPSEIELRHIEKDHLFQLLIAQHRSNTPSDFKDLIASTRAKMEAEDVKSVIKDFEDWKKAD